MKRIQIQTLNEEYPVFIGFNILNHLGDYLNHKNTTLIITDDTVKELHLNALTKHITNYLVFSLGPCAEDSKSLLIYEQCVQFALDHYLSRNIQVIAFGGGAVGDFAAFFASTYKRGVTFINIPTTLLAHDSAIGGKTALNVGIIKNAIGTFYQPKVVLYDTMFLETLPKEEILSGFGEVIKHDLLSESLILPLLVQEECLENVIKNKGLIEKIIYDCILIKKHYITDDIYDNKGIRKSLNLGHTLGHAIEKLYKLTHGEAVMYGILFELMISHRHPESYYHRFKKLGYFEKEIKFSVNKLSQIMQNDKKNENGYINFLSFNKQGTLSDFSLSEKETKMFLRVFLQLLMEW